MNHEVHEGHEEEQEQRQDQEQEFFDRVLGTERIKTGMLMAGNGGYGPPYLAWRLISSDKMMPRSVLGGHCGLLIHCVRRS